MLTPILSWDYAINVIPIISILTVDCPRLWKRWSCTPLFLSLFLPLHLYLLEHFTWSIGIPARLIVMFPHHLPAIHSVSHLNLLEKPHMLLYFVFSCIHFVHMLCVIALGGLETCGSHFISVVLFGFLFCSLVYVICITLFCFSVIVLRVAMVPDCLAYWTL